MRVLITGCAGLLGVNFSTYLLEKGYEVYGVDNLSGGYKEFIPQDVKFFEASLENSSYLDYLFSIIEPDVCFHFAAYAAEGLSPFIRRFNYVNNLISSVNVINNCIKSNCKLIFTSSMAVYGNQTPPFTEDMRQSPIDPYGIAKYAVEMDIRQAGEQFDLKYNIVRPHNVLGKYQNIWDKYRNVIGIFIRRVLNKQPILIYGDGEQTRAFSDIQYYMEPFEKLIYGFDGELFNIGADKYYKINDVADIVRCVAARRGFGTNIEYCEPRHEVKHAYCNHDKAKNLLKFEDRTDIESLINRMFIWAEGEPNRDVKYTEYEVDKNIYKFWK